MRLGSIALGALGFALAILGWSAAAAVAAGGPRAFPGPIDVLNALSALSATTGLWQVILATLGLWLLGMAAVVVLAIPVGAAIGASRTLRLWTRTTIDGMRSVPQVALIPVVLIILGTGPAMVVAMVVLAAVWPLLVQTIAGVQSIDSVTKDSARIMRLSHLQTFREIYLPGAMPFVATGLRLSSALALILVVVSGMLAATPGLGLALIQSQEAFRTADLYAYILVVGLLGVALNAAFQRLERHLLRWQSHGRG